MNEPLSLLELNSRISATVAADASLRDVWVTAETGDVRVSGGHCYLELIEKDEATGRPLARLRAIIWASQYARIATEFVAGTGQQLVSDIKVMVRVTVNFHPAFGLSAVITAINPEFTCGDLIRRRRMMIQRLTDEGIIDMNRTLEWSDTPWRVAVISAAGAAGYGDFMTHLYTNPSRLRFSTTLFPAVMQGENAPASIIEALELVAGQADEFDCVVIIRGGGATGDLASFDNYDLAANVAQFPLPVIVGIGHERDVTILDYVAAVRVKTPTAAAEWLIGRMEAALAKVRDAAAEIFRAATARVSGGLQQLAYYQGLLPSLVTGRVDRARLALSSTGQDALSRSAENILRRHRDRLEAAAQLIGALSPQAVLRRGYSISRVGGRAITDPSALSEGDVVETRLACGSFSSKVISKQ
ncbi:MAG: exodeoxyribonuclease VII large subunit [Muribaculaceae bacterium]|nr:exodeoxyribonuclease VII large subunit [Muribaculaceae bacterium]